MTTKEKKTFLLNSMMCLDLLLKAVIDCDDLSLEEKEKFSEVISGAHGECYRQLNHKPDFKLLPINQKCKSFKNN